MDAQPRSLERLADLTPSYASLSGHAGGLASALGGAIALAIAYAGATFDLSLPTRAALALAFPAWFGAKLLLRRYYYQRHGLVAAQLSTAEAAIEGVSRGAVAAIAAIVLAVCLYLLAAQPPKIAALPLANQLALAAVPALALAFARWMNSPIEAVVAIGLLVQSVILASGDPLAVGRQRGAFLWATLLIFAGLWEHFRHREIDLELRQQSGVSR